MTQDPLTLYKLIVLYMLQKVTFPMTQSQINDFLLERDYTNYLTLQQVFSELIDAGLIHAHSTHNRTHLGITEEGKKTLDFFGNRVNPEITKEIDQYFLDNEWELRNEVAIQGEYYRATSGEYEAHLTAYEKNNKLLELTLSVPTKEAAASICDEWQKKNQEIYQYLISQLF